MEPVKHETNIVNCWLVCLQLTLYAGAVSQHQLEVANASNRQASYIVTTNTPWLISVPLDGPQCVPAGSKKLLDLVCDARNMAPGANESGLVFIRDAQNSLQHEECVVVHFHAI